MTKEESPVVFMRASEFEFELQWAREAEREACARVVRFADNGTEAAELIRARSEKQNEPE